MDNAISLKDIELNIEDMNNTNSVLTINHESDNQDNQRKNSNSILSVTSDQDFFMENRKNSNTSIRTVQSMPKYTECLAADKPFANISNKRRLHQYDHDYCMCHLCSKRVQLTIILVFIICKTVYMERT